MVKLRCDLLEEALVEFMGAYERIRKMKGWQEGECDLWAAPELERANDLAKHILTIAPGLK